MMHQGEVIQKFKDLQWEDALPSQDDSPQVRQFKRANLLRALEVKRVLLDRSEAHAAQPRQLPSKRAQQLQELQNGEDAFQTPPTQRLPTLGLGSHPSKAPAAREDVATASTTGPKAAALTAQGLHMSGSTAGTSGSNAPQWRRVNRQPDSSGAAPAPRRGTKREYQQTRLAAPSGGRGVEARRAPSRLQATFTADGIGTRNDRNALAHEGNLGKGTWRAADVRRPLQVLPLEQQTKQQHSAAEIKDPIQDDDDPIASPTQSPPFGLTLSRVLDDDDDDDSPNRHRPQQQQHQQQQQKQRQKQQFEGRDQLHQKQKQKQRMALPLFVAETQPGVGTTPERQIQIEASEVTAVDDQRTTMPRLSHANLAATTLRGGTGTVIMETIPPTPAALFGFSETPGTDRPPPRLLGVPGTELANDASGRLLAGIFSPFSELAADLRAEDAAAAGGNLTFAAALVPLFNNRPLGDDSPGHVLQHAATATASPLPQVPQAPLQAPPTHPENTPGGAITPALNIGAHTGSTHRERLERYKALPAPILPQAAPIIPRGALFCAPAAPGEPESLRLRLPQPCLLAVSSTDGHHMALVLGSNADFEPAEIIVFSVSSLVQGTSNSTDADAAVHCPSLSLGGVRPIASICVQRSRHAQGIPLNASSLALVANDRGDPVLILSAVFELHDGPAPAGCPAIHAIPCIPGAPAAAVAAAVAVEHDEPFFSVLPVGKYTLLVAGETPGAAFLDFNPQWRCYTWGKRLNQALIDGGAEGADACVSLVPVQGIGRSAGGDGDKHTHVHPSDRVVIGISLDGSMSLWDIEKKACVLTARHDEFAVLEAVPLDTFASGGTCACLVPTAFAMLTPRLSLVSTENGVVEAWNMSTGTCCAVLTLSCGSALTSVTPLVCAGVGAGAGSTKPGAIVVTSSAGDCLITSIEDMERAIEMNAEAR